MKLDLEAMDFLELASTNHKLHLAAMRLHIWPSVQGDISLHPEPFEISPAKTQLYQCKTREKNSIFLKKGKTVISVENRKFSRSRMMKRIALLNSSREI